LAVSVDAGEPFVKATYKLNGDGPLALECCVERVFSLLKQFNDQQQSALEDYVETALMIQ
jgi:hypothetical protein